MIKLADIAEIRAGYPFRGAIKPIAGGAVRVVQMRDLDLASNAIRWQEAALTELPGRRAPTWLEPGDILMPSVGWRSVPVLVGDVIEPAVCSPHIFQIRLTAPGLEPGYVVWALRQSGVQRQIAEAATGSGVKLLRRSVLEGIELPIPDISRQLQIAQLMADAISERRALEALIVNRERQLAGIAQKLFKEEFNQEVVS